MRDVWIVGVGMTRFGKLPLYGVRELAEEATFAALKDAGAKPADIQIAYCGTESMAPDTPMLPGQIALEQMGITGIPITNVANACGSGSNAVREAWLALQSGLYDVALAIGVEKLKLGMDMEMVLEHMMSDRFENDIICYKFRPVSDAPVGA